MFVRERSLVKLVRQSEGGERSVQCQSDKSTVCIVVNMFAECSGGGGRVFLLPVTCFAVLRGINGWGRGGGGGMTHHQSPSALINPLWLTRLKAPNKNSAIVQFSEIKTSGWFAASSINVLNHALSAFVQNDPVVGHFYSRLRASHHCC